MSKRIVSVLMVLVLLSLVVFIPASATTESQTAAVGPQIEQATKTITIRVRMMHCTTVKPPIGCLPLHDGYWQWKLFPGSPTWVQGGAPDTNGYGIAQVVVDQFYQGTAYCKGYNFPDGSENITSVLVRGTTSKQVDCPNLYSLRP